MAERLASASSDDSSPSHTPCLAARRARCAASGPPPAPVTPHPAVAMASVFKVSAAAGAACAVRAARRPPLAWIPPPALPHQHSLGISHCGS